MAWSTNKTWSPGEDLTADDMNQYVRDQLDETAPGIATAPGRLIVTDAAHSLVERVPSSASVATSETTASTSYTGLATTGPNISAVTSGTTAMIWISCDMANNTAGARCHMSVSVTGASAEDPHDATSLTYESSNANDRLAASYMIFFVGLTPGSNTFNSKYHVSAGTGTFLRRTIVVLPL
jgi:hypothetical protein